MNITVFLGLLIIGLFALAVLWLERALIKKSTAVAAVILVALAMTVRGLGMNYETLDYQDFLTQWVSYFRLSGGWSALSGDIGNYNVPYLYFLALFSYSGIRDLYLIKFLSIFFDVILAWGVMRIVYVYRRTAASVLTAFFVTLFLPTVVLNGSVWGQCDSIYAAFAVLSIYFALDRRPVLSMISIALSFAFKLQAVFIMPVFLVFLFDGRLKWRHLPLFPLTYLAAVLPAVLAGRPLLDTILIYFRQAGSVGNSLNYNSPSFFAFIRKTVDNQLFSILGIAAAAVMLALIFVWMFFRRDRLTDRSLLACSMLICVGVPFFLPHMHERYFFMADVLSVALAVVSPQLFFVPLCVCFASFLGYYAYFVMRFLLPMYYGAAALVLVMIVTALALAGSFRHGRRAGR